MLRSPLPGKARPEGLSGSMILLLFAGKECRQTRGAIVAGISDRSIQPDPSGARQRRVRADTGAPSVFQGCTNNLISTWSIGLNEAAPCSALAGCGALGVLLSPGEHRRQPSYVDGVGVSRICVGFAFLYLPDICSSFTETTLCPVDPSRTPTPMF